MGPDLKKIIVPRVKNYPLQRVTVCQPAMIIKDKTRFILGKEIFYGNQGARIPEILSHEFYTLFTVLPGFTKLSITSKQAVGGKKQRHI